MVWLAGCGTGPLIYFGRFGLCSHPWSKTLLRVQTNGLGGGDVEGQTVRVKFWRESRDFDIFVCTDELMVVLFHYLPPAPHPAARQALFQYLPPAPHPAAHRQVKGEKRQPGDNNNCEEKPIMEKDLSSLCELAFAMEEDDAALGGNELADGGLSMFSRLISS